MKKVILLLILIVAVKSAIAECATSEMKFFPETRTISLNPTFIIEG